MGATAQGVGAGPATPAWLGVTQREVPVRNAPYPAVVAIKATSTAGASCPVGGTAVAGAVLRQTKAARASVLRLGLFGRVTSPPKGMTVSAAITGIATGVAAAPTDAVVWKEGASPVAGQCAGGRGKPPVAWVRAEVQLPTSGVGTALEGPPCGSSASLGGLLVAQARRRDEVRVGVRSREVSGLGTGSHLNAKVSSSVTAAQHVENGRVLLAVPCVWLLGVVRTPSNARVWTSYSRRFAKERIGRISASGRAERDLA